MMAHWHLDVVRHTCKGLIPFQDTLRRIKRRAPVPIEDRDAFKTLPVERSITPESLRLDPRTKNETDG